MQNAAKVKEWRENVLDSCKSAKTDEDMVSVRKTAEAFSSSLHENESKGNKDLQNEYFVQKCPFVFLDLGSGAGDTIGQFIDAGMVGCRRSDSDMFSFDPFHFDVDTGTFKDVEGTRRGEKDEDFTDWVKTSIDSFYPGLGPEDYCVYGVEGNPLLKIDLIKLERHINRMDPRPLRHLHFFTETAIHSEDNVKKVMFVDSLNDKEKFPGSSLFPEHKSIRASIAKFKDTFKYTIDSLTLSSLMNQTLSFYNDDSARRLSDSSKEGPVDRTNSTSEDVDQDFMAMESSSRQHLMLYLDVEGSEFLTLNEAVDSGVLCDFANSNNNIVDILIEYHSPDIMNIETPSAKRFMSETRPKLLSEECGGFNLRLKERMKYFTEASA